MHIIIIGCGKVGSKFAQVLSEVGHDVVIVDNDRKAFDLLEPDFNGVTINGVPIDQDVLKKAGIETADAVAAVTPDDNTNIMVCQMAKEIYKIPKVIARIYNPSREHVFHQFGLETICPTNITVEVIKSIVLGDSGVTNHTIGSSVIAFRHEKVPKNVVGKRLIEISIKQNCFLFGIIKNSKFNFANPNIYIDKDDILVMTELID